MKVQHKNVTHYNESKGMDEATKLNPIALDLSQFSNNKVNRTLEFNNALVGQIFIKDDIFYLKLDDNAPKITISAFPLQKKIIIESSNDISIAAIKNSSLDGLVITANNIDIQSDLTVAKGIALEAKQTLSISSALENLGDAFFDCNILQIKGNGSVQFKESLAENLVREIKARTFSLDNESHVLFEHVHLLVGAIDSNGKLEMNGCNIIAESLNISGAYSIKNSACILEEAAYFNGDKTSILHDMTFEAESCCFSGENTCNNVDFVTDNMAFSANTKSVMRASRFDVLNGLLLDEKSRTNWDSCCIYTDSAQFKGAAHLENCKVESVTCSTSDQTILKSTDIEARLFWQDEGAEIERCSIIAESSSLLKKTAIQHTKIVTNSLNYSSAGTLDDCWVTVTQCLSGSETSNVTFKQCLLETGQTYTQGILHFTDKSHHKTNYLQQSMGTITINDSIVENAGLLFSMPDTVLSAENNANIAMQSAFFYGESNWSDSRLSALGPLVFCGKMTGEKVAIGSHDSLYLTQNTHALNNSFLESKKQVIVTGDLILSEQSALHCEALHVSSNNSFIENSKITAHDLNILNQFSVKKSGITLQSNLTTFHASSTQIEDSSLSAENMTFMGALQVARSELRAEANIIFEHFSKSDLNTVKLFAGKDIVNERLSEISGDKVDAKSEHFKNAGKLKIDVLMASASTIDNSGSVASDESVQFKANSGMLNTGPISANDIKIQACSLMNVNGQIAGFKNTTIQAPLLVNYMGDIQSSGSLSMDSLAHFNLVGAERAYDYTSRSGYNCNYGLILPDLPNSWDDVFSVSRGISMAKMGLIQLLPDYSNLIAMGFMAAPYVGTSTKLLYDCYRTTDSTRDFSFRMYHDLSEEMYNAGVGSINNFTKQFAINESADTLPAMMNAMSTGLSLVQLANVVEGVCRESGIKNTVPMPPDNTKCPETNPEKNDTNNDVGNDESNAKNVCLQAIESIGDIAIKVLAPSMNIESIFNYNGGGTLSVNLMESCQWREDNEAFKGAWNVTGKYGAGENRGCFVGLNMAVSGDFYENYGRFSSSRSTRILFKDGFTNNEGANLKLANFLLKSDRFTNAGMLDLKDGKIDATDFLQTGTGHANIARTSALIKNDAIFNGTYELSDNSQFVAKNVTLHDQGHISQSIIIAENKVAQSGELIATDTILSGENVSLDGAKLKKTLIKAKQKLTIKNSNAEDTGISGNELGLRDSQFKSSKPAKETSDAKPVEETANTADSEGQDKINPETIPPAGLRSNQIEAKESLYTDNVEMEGQYIDANTANFGGRITMIDCLTKARDAIVFEKKALVKTHNARYLSTNTIAHHSTDHKQTGYLEFKSKDVQISKSSSLYSGKGANNLFYVKADSGNFKGKMKLDRGHFDVKNLTDAEDLIGQRGQSTHHVFATSLTVETDQIINIENMKPRDCDVMVSGDAVNVKNDYKSDKKVTFIATKGKVIIDANLTGDVVALQSKKENVEINGKEVSATKYVYVDAGKHVLVNNTCDTYQGKYDVEKKYNQARIIGGAGTEETQGKGVIIHAKNKVKMKAPIIEGQGGAVQIRGDKGVRIKAEMHARVTEEWSKDKRCMGVKHGKKKYQRIETKLWTATISSTGGKVQIISSKGYVKGVGGDFLAKDGTDIYAKKNITLKGLVAKTQIRKKNSSCFGLNSKKSKDTFQHAKLVDFVDDGGQTRLHSYTRNIKGTDVRFRGKGDVQFSAPKGSAKFRGSKLNHSHKVRERKFSMSSPALDSGKHLRSDKKRLAKQAEPTLGHIETLINAKNPLEMAASIFNTVISGSHAMGVLQQGNYGQQLVQGAGFIPRINASLSETKTSSHFQTGTGSGIFTEGNVSFNTKKAVSLEGMDIAGKNLQIKTEKLTMKGQAFHSSHSSKNRSVNVGVNPVAGGATDASVSASSQKMKANHYQNMGINIQKKIDIEAKNVVMDAVNIETKTIKLKADTLTIQSRQDELSVQNKSVNASTTGAVGIHQSNTESRQVNQVAGIHVRSGIAKGDIQVKEANLIGAAISSDGYNGFEPEKLNTVTLKDHSYTDGFGISGNVTSVISNPEGSSRLTTFNFAHEKREYKAQVQATVYGKKGVSENMAKNENVNSSSSQAKVVTRDTSHKIALDVPLELIDAVVQTGFAFFENTDKADKNRAATSVEEDTAMPAQSGEHEELIEAEPDTSSAISVGNDDIEMSDELENETEDELEDETEEGRKSGTFNPKPRPQTVCLKKGRNGNQLSNERNGQYTTVEKEMDISAENSRVRGVVDLILLEGGDKKDGLYYKAKIDPLANQLIIEAGSGTQYCLNLDNDCADLGLAGSASYAIDAGGVDTLIRTHLQATSTSASAVVQGGFGIMGPSVTGTYTTPCFSFMGFTLRITAEGSLGVGAKINAGAGVEANANKMKVGAVAKVGFFKGIGLQGVLKTEFGVDLKYQEGHHNAYVEVFEKDHIAMSILAKIKNYEYVSGWERDYFNDQLDEVSIRAQFNCWFGTGK